MTTIRMSTGRAASEPYELPVSGSLSLARWATAAVVVSLLISAVAGLRYGEDDLYRSDALLLPQMYDQDLIALVVALPMLIGAVRGARRGSARGLAVWAGTLIYVAYWYHFYLRAIPFGPLFLVHATLVGSSLLALGVLLARVDIGRFAHRFSSKMPARSIGGMLATLGAVFATAWIVDIVDGLRHRDLVDPVALGVYAVDLTIMLPATVVAGVLLWKHDPWGYALSGPLLINAALTMVTLLVASVLVRAAGVQVAGLAIASLAIASALLAAGVARYLRDVRV